MPNSNEPTKNKDYPSYFAATKQAASALETAGSERPDEPSVAMRLMPMLNMVAAIKYKKRRQDALEPVAKAHGDLMDKLIEDGADVEQARALAMMKTASRLRQLGFQSEADAMQTAGVDNLKAWRDTRLARRQTEADIANTKSLTRERDARLDWDSETYIKLDKDTGQITNWQQVPVLQPGQARTLEQDGWIAMNGNLAAAMNMTPDDFGTMRVPSGSVQDNIIAGFSMLNNIEVLRSIKDQTGFLQGWWRSWAASRGLTFADNEQFIKAEAVRKKMKADIQSLVKGIPSNYDAKIFEAMIPDPGRFAGTAIYEAQLDLIEDTTKDLIRLTIAFHKGTNQEFNPAVIGFAQQFDIDIDEVTPMTPEEIAQVNADRGKAFDKQDNPFSRNARARQRESDQLYGKPADETTAALDAAIMEKVRTPAEDE